MHRVVVERIVFYPPQNGYSILLHAPFENMVLPIVIGSLEAQAIVQKMEEIEMSRPQAHDLMVNLIVKMDAKVENVVISDLKHNQFYATINLLQSNGTKMSIDARPSDAVAVAVRTDSTIFVAQHVMADAGISEEKSRVFYAPIRANVEGSDSSQRLRPRMEKLREAMKQAIDEEDYEIAAILRDRIASISKEA